MRAIAFSWYFKCLFYANRIYMYHKKKNISKEKYMYIMIDIFSKYIKYKNALEKFYELITDIVYDAWKMLGKPNSKSM